MCILLLRFYYHPHHNHTHNHAQKSLEKPTQSYVPILAHQTEN